MLTVELDWSEALHAAQGGVMRRLRALRRGISNHVGAPPHGLWNADIEAACAELAFAKATNQYWTGPGTMGKPRADVGFWEVRHTAYRSGRLIVKDHDNDESLFVLVRGSCPRFTIVGYKRGGDAKNEKWREEHQGRSGFFVPNDELVDFEVSAS